MILAELIQEIAAFLATPSDIYRLLVALPTSSLTESLQHLRTLVLLQAHDQVRLTKNEPCQCNNNLDRLPCKLVLWPHLRAGCFQVNSEIADLLQKCIALFPVIYNSPTLPRLKIPPGTKLSSNIDSVLDFKNALLNPQVHALGINVNTYGTMLDPLACSALATYLPTLPNLTHIKLYWGCTDQSTLIRSLQVLESLKTLRSFHLELHPNLNWTDEMTMALANWATKNSSTNLTIDNFALDNGQLFNMYFKGCTTWLMELALSRIVFKNRELTGVQLRSIHECDIGELIALTQCSNLELFDISFVTYQVKTQKHLMLELLTSIAQMNKLRSLSISNYPMNTECCERIAALVPQLVELKLISNNLTDDAAIALVCNLSTSSRLKVLCLRDQCLQDSGAVVVANAITRANNVREVSLRCNQVGDVGAIALSTILYKLDSIDLSFNAIRHNGILAIKDHISTTAHMELIDLSHNQLSVETALELITSLKVSSPRLGCVKMHGVLRDRSAMNQDRYTNILQELPSQTWCSFKFS